MKPIFSIGFRFDLLTLVLLIASSAMVFARLEARQERMRLEEQRIELGKMEQSFIRSIDQ